MDFIDFATFSRWFVSFWLFDLFIIKQIPNLAFVEDAMITPSYGMIYISATCNTTHDGRALEWHSKRFDPSALT